MVKQYHTFNTSRHHELKTIQKDSMKNDTGHAQLYTGRTNNNIIIYLYTYIGIHTVSICMDMHLSPHTHSHI